MAARLSKRPAAFVLLLRQKKKIHQEQRAIRLPRCFIPPLKVKLKKIVGMKGKNPLYSPSTCPLIFYTYYSLYKYLSQADTTPFHCGAELYFPQKISKSSFIFSMVLLCTFHFVLAYFKRMKMI